MIKLAQRFFFCSLKIEIEDLTVPVTYSHISSAETLPDLLIIYKFIPPKTSLDLPLPCHEHFIYSFIHPCQIPVTPVCKQAPDGINKQAIELLSPVAEIQLKTFGVLLFYFNITV